MLAYIATAKASLVTSLNRSVELTLGGVGTKFTRWYASKYLINKGKWVVPLRGLEPLTPSLRMMCSTT